MITIVSYIILVGIMGIAYTIGFSYMGFLVVPSIMILSVCVIVDFNKGKRTRPLSKPLTLGYMWRLSLLILDIYGRDIYHLPNSGADSVMFYNMACTYAKTGDAGRGGIFSEVIGALFKVIGPNRLFGQYTIMLFSVVTMCAFAWIAFELNVSQAVKLRSMYLVALLPNVAILSSIFLRESIVAMMVALSIYNFVQWYCTKKESYFFLAIAFSFIGAAFHSGVVAIAVGYIIVRFFYNNNIGVFNISAKNLIIVGLLFVIFVFLFINYQDLFFEKFNGVESIEDIAGTTAIGGSTYATYVGDSSSPSSMIKYTIPRMVYFLFSPFPWQWRGINDIIAFCFSSLFYMFVCLDTCRFILKKRQNNRALVILIVIVALIVSFVFAWGISNTGTAARHREKLIIIYATLYLLTHRENSGLILKVGNKRIF